MWPENTEPPPPEMLQIGRIGRPTIQGLDCQNVRCNQCGQFIAKRGLRPGPILIQDVRNRRCSVCQGKAQRQRFFFRVMSRKRAELR